MAEEKKIDFAAIEKKWQKKWEEKKAFKTEEKSKKQKFYCLEMYPYPSASFLHVGHVRNYTIGDIIARFKRMQGFSVLYPMGYDSFGLPAENAAKKAGIHPRKYAEDSIKKIMAYQKALGNSYDWDRILASHEPDYYKWNQFFFLKLLQKGLAYRKKAPVNWCPKCESVLANEESESGKCWRCENEVVKKDLEQWFFKITDYADRLLEDVKKLEWPEKIKIMQENWIGKSHGSEIDFEIFEDIKNCIIIHGSPSKDRTKEPDYKPESEKHWITWIKEKLEKRGIKIETPEMPTPWAPKYEEWKKIMDKFEVNENTILIGHSAGGAFLVKWLNETGKKIKKLILVSAGKEGHESRGVLSEFYRIKSRKNIKNNVRKIIIFTSDDDIDYHIPVAYEYQKELGGKLIHLGEGYGHFCEKEMGTKEFPELFNEIIEKWPIFTTRPDTIYGVTFMVVSVQHPRLMELVTEKQKKEVIDFVEKSKKVKSQEEIEKLDKEGVFTGSFAVNPLTKEKVPVYAGNFVLADYGSGMVMAVPAHDQRDFEFAKKYKIPIKEVIMPVFGEKHENEEFRKTISAVIHRKKDNKFLIMKWKKMSWVSPVVGGIEDKEEIGKAAEREVLEESGYKTKFIKKLGGEIECHFYADHKKVWRHRLDQPVLLELINDKPEKISEEENNLHEVVWLSAEQALKEMTHKYNNFGILRYLGKDEAYTDSGTLVNSGKFSGLESEKAKEEIIKELENKKLGRKTTNYKIRDWLISRQRYWGTPIPIIYCEKCGIVPVPEKVLPVLLPEKVDFKNKNPLAANKEFMNVKCPKCGGKGKRETDTMGGFVDSSWYFLRYCDNKNKKEAFDKKKVEYWMPVDQYIGGAEHAVMHLMYARFFIKALKDLGFVNFGEPFKKLFNQGIVYKEGSKMSKSAGNVVYQTDISDKYGIDTARLFLMFVSSPDKQMEWSDEGVEGSFRIINRLVNLKDKVSSKSGEREESKINSAIKKVTSSIESFEYPKAIIAITEAMDSCSLGISRKNYETLLKLISPFCPHIAEELWEKLGNKGFISLESWPKADESKINLKLEEQEKAVDKLGDDILNIVRIIKERDNKQVTNAYIYTLPKELELYKDNLELIKKKTSLDVKVFAVNDKDKFDPEGKAGKAKPGKPAIYLE